jgi:coenzyme Q-binding protein COQ10
MPTHAEKRKMPYTAAQLYKLVAEVDRYPEFLPWCIAARLKTRETNIDTWDLVIGFKMIRERFTSKVTLAPPDPSGRARIDVAYADGPFRYLANHWIFEPQHDGGCEIDFYVDFEFRSRMLQSIMGMLFNEAVKRMVAAFDARARALYGEKPI